MIGYYAHHHGSGHLTSANYFAKKLKGRLKIFSSLENNKNKEISFLLPTEDPDGTAFHNSTVELPSYLHYSPVGQQSIYERSLLLLNYLKTFAIQLMIIDVSVEIAALCRSSSVPYAYVRLPGNRNDKPHLDAFKGAIVLLAYFPEALESSNTPNWVKEKTIYTGFLSSENRKSVSLPKIETTKRVLIISGKGGNDKLESSAEIIAEIFKGYEILAAGNFNKKVKGIRYLGFVNNLPSYLVKCDIIICNCGLNTIATVLPIHKPTVLIPEERPFSEQITMCKQLLKYNRFYTLKDIESDCSVLFKDVEPLIFPSALKQDFFKILAEKNNTTSQLLTKLIDIKK